MTSKNDLLYQYERQLGLIDRRIELLKQLGGPSEEEKLLLRTELMQLSLVPADTEALRKLIDPPF